MQKSSNSLKIAVLAQFPVHILPEFEKFGEPKVHYATWLPQLVRNFENLLQSREPIPSSWGEPRPDKPPLEIHWLTLSTLVDRLQVSQFCGQIIHVLPTKQRGRASTFFRADRASLQSRLNEIGPHIVHGWGNEDVYGWAAVASGRLNIVSVQGLLSECVLRSPFPLRTYFQAVLELFVLNWACYIVCESQWACEKVKMRLVRRAKPLLCIDYGVHEYFYKCSWNPRLGKPIAIFAGSVDPHKGIQDVIAAFRDSRLRDAELWVLGSDNSPQAAAIKKIAPPNVIWFGRRPIREVIERLAQGWCFVLPTRADTGPMAVKEARVVGLPVICTPCSGARDYIRHEKNGFLVKPGDVKNLTHYLAKLLSNLDICRQMGAYEHELARNRFAPMKTAELPVGKGFLISSRYAANIV